MIQGSDGLPHLSVWNICVTTIGEMMTTKLRVQEVVQDGKRYCAYRHAIAGLGQHRNFKAEAWDRHVQSRLLFYPCNYRGRRKQAAAKVQYQCPLRGFSLSGITSGRLSRFLHPRELEAVEGGEGGQCCMPCNLHCVQDRRIFTETAWQDDYFVHAAQREGSDGDNGDATRSYWCPDTDAIYLPKCRNLRAWHRGRSSPIEATTGSHRLCCRPTIPIPVALSMKLSRAETGIGGEGQRGPD
ncbi:hypothetical protein F4777DRAFT_476831 [Nemania sp. FL0916]|nr:hypothetical protein F4777DRAFT_476831 [Nemania sp. FL0916]